MVDLTGRVAIVTGSGGGLGRAHALLLARYGARVVVNDLIPDAAENVAAAIVAAGGEAIATTASVTDETRIAAMVTDVLDRWGRIDILINNAGILRDKSFAKMAMDDFRRVLDVHVMGAAICSQAVWGVMRAQRYGRIVMTTSSSGLFGNFGQANYSAAKMAVVGLMQTLSIEGAKYDIRVNCLAPTAATAMTDDLMTDEVKSLLRPELVSPGIVKLVGTDAPTRAILCGGGGHFERAYVTLTAGVHIGEGDDAAERVAARWDAIGDQEHQTVPLSCAAQIERELAGAQSKVSA